MVARRFRNHLEAGPARPYVSCASGTKTQAPVQAWPGEFLRRFSASAAHAATPPVTAACGRAEDAKGCMITTSATKGPSGGVTIRSRVKLDLGSAGTDAAFAASAMAETMAENLGRGAAATVSDAAAATSAEPAADGPGGPHSGHDAQLPSRGGLVAEGGSPNPTKSSAVAHSHTSDNTSVPVATAVAEFGRSAQLTGKGGGAGRSQGARGMSGHTRSSARRYYLGSTSALSRRRCSTGREM